jgi:hypothetical protein
VSSLLFLAAVASGAESEREKCENRSTQVGAAREDMWCLRGCFIYSL